jgi:hypothetical protein
MGMGRQENMLLSGQADALAEIALGSDGPFGVIGACASLKDAVVSRLLSKGVRLSFLPDPVAFCPWASVARNVKFAERSRPSLPARPARPAGRLPRPEAGAAGAPSRRRAQAKAACEETLALFELDKLGPERPDDLPAISIKELGLAMARAQRPDAYVLERPTADLDRADATHLASLIKSRLGKPILVFTDNYEEIERICGSFSVVAPVAPGAYGALGALGAPVAPGAPQKIRAISVDEALSVRPTLREYVDSL